jgi:hypothetical protein
MEVLQDAFKNAFENGTLKSSFSSRNPIILIFRIEDFLRWSSS